MDWIKVELGRGIQKLICLSLDHQPANELMVGTIQAWVEVITDGREFVQKLDAQRFRKAFVALAGGVRWPTPRDFIAALPERDQLRLAKTPIKADPARAAAACAEIAKALGKTH